jgi:RNA polymerase sigma factor (sigma-70 family)
MENHKLADILEGCRRKERAAQKELYRQFYGYAMSICLRYGDSEDEAIEVANDAFLKVFLNIQRYDPDMPFKPWFRRILINTAINYIKKKLLRNAILWCTGLKNILPQKKINNNSRNKFKFSSLPHACII